MGAAAPFVRDPAEWPEAIVSDLGQCLCNTVSLDWGINVHEHTELLFSHVLALGPSCVLANIEDAGPLCQTHRWGI